MSRIVVSKLSGPNLRSTGVQQCRSYILDLVNGPIKVVRVLQKKNGKKKSTSEEKRERSASLSPAETNLINQPYLTQCQVLHSQFDLLLGGMGEVQSHDFHARLDDPLQRFQLFRGGSDGGHDLGQLVRRRGKGVGIDQIERRLQGSSLSIGFGIVPDGKFPYRGDGGGGKASMVTAAALLSSWKFRPIRRKVGQVATDGDSSNRRRHL